MAKVSFKERFIQGANVGANSFFKLFDSPKRNPAKYMQDTYNELYKQDVNNKKIESNDNSKGGKKGFLLKRDR